MKQTYTVKEVADILGYSTNSIYTFLKEKRIKGVRVGKGRFRIPDTEVSRLLGEKGKPRTTLLAPAVSSFPVSVREPAVSGSEPVPVHYRIEVPSLFDWFAGVASVVTGLSVLLFAKGYEEYALTGAGAWTPVIAALLLSGGAGLLLSDITGYGKTVWCRVFRIFLILGFGSLAASAASALDPEGTVLYSAVAFAVFLSFMTPFSGVVLFTLYSAVTTAVVSYLLAPATGLPVLKAFWQAVPFPLYAATVILGNAAVTYLAWRSYRGNRFFFWSLVAMTGMFQIGIAVIEAQHLLWGRTFLFSLTAVVSLFLPSWDSLTFTRKTDRRLTFGIFGMILAVFVLALVSVRLVGGSLLAYTATEMLSKAGYAQVSLDNAFQSARTSLESSAGNTAVKAQLTAKNRSAGVLSGIVRSLYESNPSLSRVSLLTADASAAASYPLMAESNRENYAGNPVVLNAFATGRTQTAKTVTATGDRAGLVTIAVPVLGEDGNPVGAYVGGVSLKHIGARLQKLSSPVTGENVWIISEPGQVLFGMGSAPQLTGTSEAEGTSEEIIDGVRTLVTYRKAESGPWRVVLTMPVTSVFRLAHTAGYTVMAVTVLPLALYMVFLFFHRGTLVKTAEDGT